MTIAEATTSKVFKMTLGTLLLLADDRQLVYLTIDGNRYSGYSTEQHMIELLIAYGHRPVDITREEDTLIVARVRRY